jgi:restriction system protein
MRDYYRVMLGRKSKHAEECFAAGCIGTGFLGNEDLTGRLPEDWRAFNRQFIPLLQAKEPEKTRVGAGLACGALWTVSKGIRVGDRVLCPDGVGSYRVAEVTGEYMYRPGQPLEHRRPVRWLSQTIDRANMSEALRNSTGSIGTVCKIAAHRDEIEKLLAGCGAPSAGAGEEVVEDPAAFAMEKHLEDFLVQNWEHTELGKHYDIYEEDGERVGQQYLTDTGPLDILAISKDKKHLLVVELKKGRASDAVVGQALRYMGYVQEELAEDGQAVKGAIIAMEDDQRIRRALLAAPHISFYRYQISFKLVKA